MLTHSVNLRINEAPGWGKLEWLPATVIIWNDTFPSKQPRGWNKSRLNITHVPWIILSYSHKKKNIRYPQKMVEVEFTPISLVDFHLTII